MTTKNAGRIVGALRPPHRGETRVLLLSGARSTTVADQRAVDAPNHRGGRMLHRRRVISRRMIAVTVGTLFFVQMVTGMFGTSLIQAFVDGETDRVAVTVGVLLMVCSGIAVVGIGLLMYQVLKSVNHWLAFSYPVLRVVEFTVSTVCGVYLLAQMEVVPNYLLWVYIPTGIGGLVLNYLLFVSKLVPRPIAVLGLVGYVLLSVGVVLDLLGVLDMNAGPGMVLLVPGFLFEFAVFPIWLIAKGFRSALSVEEFRSPALATRS
jgi:Domain of unknown function (DUF4386)